MSVRRSAVRPVLGAGHYHPDAAPPPEGIQLDAAAQRTLAALDAAFGVLTVVED